MIELDFTDVISCRLAGAMASDLAVVNDNGRVAP